MQREHVHRDRPRAPATATPEIDTGSAGPASRLIGMPPPRVIDEHAAHHLRGDAEEVRAVFPRDAALRQQTDVRLVDDRRRLQRLPAALAAQVAGGEPAKLALHALHELRFGLGETLSATASAAGSRRCREVRSAGLVSGASVTRRFANVHILPRVSGVLGGGTRFFVACSNAYASSISRGSLHAMPVKLTPNGAGFASKPSGNGGVGAFGTSANGTMTVG